MSMLPLRLWGRWVPTGHTTGDPPPTHRRYGDAYKDYTRTQYRTIISKVRKNNRLALEEAERRAQSLEANYVITKDAGTYAAMLTLHKEISVLRTTATRKLLLSQRIFEQGESSGRLLVWLARERFTIAHIANIKDDQGHIQSDPLLINARFAHYYEQLDTSRADFTPASLQDFLAQIEFPTLSEEEHIRLDDPITL